MQSFPDPQGRMDRTLGVVLMRDRGPEQRHDPIPKELIHRPLVQERFFYDEVI